jgi:hypothetical protein
MEEPSTKENKMQVKIVSVRQEEKNFKGKITNYRILTAENGTEYKVSENSRYTYQAVQGEGIYDIEMGEYMGHPVVKKLKAIAAASAAAPKQQATVAAPAVNEKARLDFAAAKQNEIKLECYAGIAKDCLIANGKKDIKAKDVMQFAKDLMLFHNTIIELGDDLPGYGVDFLQDLKEAFPGMVVEKEQPKQAPVQQEFTEEAPF